MQKEANARIKINKLTKSKSRVRDHGEVFTPDFIVNDMLDLVKDETERIESRFLEPACGNGNFLIKILERKLKVVKKENNKNQLDYEINSLVSVSSIYGIDLLSDNVRATQKRLYDFFLKEYKKLYRQKVNNSFLKSIEYILNRNILQGDATTLKNNKECPIIFSEWSLVNKKMIERRDFNFVYLTELYNNHQNNKYTKSLFAVEEISDTGRTTLSPSDNKKYPPVNFLKLHTAYE